MKLDERTAAVAAPTIPRKRTAARRTAPSAAATPAHLCVGLVVSPALPGDGVPRFAVHSAGLEAIGRVAASCLLQPVAGDTVACLRVAPDELWITAVLQREEGATQVLRCSGPARLEVAGALAIEADALALRSRGFELQADSAHLAVGEAELTARQLSVGAAVFKVVGATLSTVFERVQHYSRQYLRTTEGIDRVKADHVECEARQLLRLSGQHAVINGEKLVKARGGQIHLG